MLHRISCRLLVPYRVARDSGRARGYVKKGRNKEKRETNHGDWFNSQFVVGYVVVRDAPLKRKVNPTPPGPQKTKRQKDKLKHTHNLDMHSVVEYSYCVFKEAVQICLIRGVNVERASEPLSVAWRSK